ncbi:MAG: ROK family transcriptional regulator [Ruminococcus sp.]|nr:ROK family transcriptional regulator [Ruminococcus sp.]
MTTGSMTTMEVKKINRHNIYTFIYQQKNSSKQQIVDSLHISLSTVTQNLKLLEAEGLVEKAGYYQSTGGRKAYNFEIVKDARIAIGIDILKDRVHIVAVDLYGMIMEKCTQALGFLTNENYYQKLGDLVSDFIRNGNWEPDCLLGAGIAIQGIADEEGTSVNYGPILDNYGLHLSTLAQYIPCQCHLVHDSKAAALAELWHDKDITDAAVLFLNENMGGALIRDRKIYQGENLRGGLLEHISVDPQGELCYCGSRGCLETICSANKLRVLSGLTLDEFFQKLRGGDERLRGIWEGYLDRIAFAIRNLQVILDTPVIISGLLANYMTAEDFEELKTLVTKYAPFPFPRDFLLAGQYGPLAPAIGSALFFIDKWIQAV